MKSPNEKAVHRVVIATGISSIVTQLYTIREFLTLFEGNEFIIALIIFNWLALGGTGTLLARLYSGKKPGIDQLAMITFLLAALSPFQIILIRYLRDIVFVHGSSVGFYPTFFYTLLTISPYALLIGFVLPLSLFVIRLENPGYSGATIYIIDNIGDLTGGALFSFALVYLVSPLKALLLANLVLIAAAFLLIRRGRLAMSVAVLCAVFALSVNVFGVFVEKKTLDAGEGELVHYEETRFGRLTVKKNNGEFTLFEDGVPVYISGNLMMAEEAVHYALCQVQSPKDILAVSSVAGIMEEIDKYRPDRIDYVELDPALSAAQFRFSLLKEIPGLRVIHQDARAYLDKTTDSYDAIIMNLPEPETFQVNRFYTDEFFAVAKKRLRPFGVMGFSLKGYDNYLGEPQRQKVSSLYNTAKRHFSNIVMLPGTKIFFLCTDGIINTDIPEALRQKGIKTGYISGYFAGDITKDRREYLAGSIDDATPVNTDTDPYMMQVMFAQWFAEHQTSPVWFFVCTGTVFALYFLVITREEFVLFSTGATVMGSEVLIIFIFQILFGYIYLKIGIIVSVFLAGLLPGAFLGRRLSGKTHKVLVLTDMVLVMIMALIVVILKIGGQGFPQMLFYCIAFGISLLCGFQFPVALSLRGGDNISAVRTFSADLVGAAFGAVIISSVLIPYLGIVQATLGLIVLKTASIMVVRGSHGKDQQAGVPVR